MPRGGARENSGRKPKWNLGDTKAIRVPVAIADTILEIARRLDDGEKLESIIIPKSAATTPELSADERGKSKSSAKDNDDGQFDEVLADIEVYRGELDAEDEAE
jgi:hypothetical protein